MKIPSIVKLVFLLSPLCAQTQTAHNCPQQNVVVNVRDQGGDLITGLPPTAFQASLRGHPVSILSAKLNANVPRIALLLDVSGSMSRSSHQLDKAQLLAKDLVIHFLTAHIALVIFSDHILDTLGFESGRNAILEKLSSQFDGKGPTAIFDSLMYSADLFQSSESGDAVYLISDGGDSRSKFRERDVERKFVAKGIRLFFFSVQNGPLSTLEERTGVLDVKHLTEVTGGSFINKPYPYAPESKRLDAVLRLGYDLMSHFYELQVALPGGLDAEQSWELRVIGEDGKKPKLEITYPNLPPCPLQENHS